MIAIGDHVYWDLRSPVGSVMLGNAPEAQKLVGQFVRDVPVLGTDNERKLKLVATPQICDLYGTDFRSTPTVLRAGRSRLLRERRSDRADGDVSARRLHAAAGARRRSACITRSFCPTTAGPIGLPSSGAADRARRTSRSRSARCATAGCWKS